MVWKVLLIVVPLFALALSSCPPGEDCCTDPAKINRTDVEDVGEAYFEDGVKINYKQLEQTASYEIKFENTNENATQVRHLSHHYFHVSSLFGMMSEFLPDVKYTLTSLSLSLLSLSFSLPISSISGTLHVGSNRT